MFEPNTPSSNKILEELAALEHLQWAHWTEQMLEKLEPWIVPLANYKTAESEDLAETLARWHRQINTPYEELDEKEKESDRAWARRAMGITVFTAQQVFEKWANNLEKRLKKKQIIDEGRE